MTRFMYFSVAALMFAAALPASATEIYCTVVGTVQGTFPGDPATHAKHYTDCRICITQELKVPFDATTGQSTGKSGSTHR